MALKDYYRILQVDHQAEPDVIEAAYRRLIRKYHPDVLGLEQQDDPDILRKVQALNEAYEVLSDPQKRQQYDRELRSAEQQPKPRPLTFNVERRIYLVKCSTTKRTFKMLLGRPAGSTNPFRVLGFELVVDSSPKLLAEGRQSFVKRTWEKLVQKRAIQVATEQAPADLRFPSDAEIGILLEEATTLNLGDIDWAGHKCPDCAGELVKPNGNVTRWALCGGCSHLHCLGNARRILGAFYCTCPWCGRVNRITRTVSTGSKDYAPIKGKVSADRVESSPSNQTLLRGEQKKSLDVGKK